MGRGSAVNRSESDAKLARYVRLRADYGFAGWAIDDKNGEYFGYVGLLPIPKHHPAGSGVEIGWRLRRSAWGRGFATEGARAALIDAFGRLKLKQVLAYTAPDNLRSQAVMNRVGMTRSVDRDFRASDGWVGWVWAISPAVKAQL